MSYVYTNGCFDGLHRGHEELLAYCRRLAGPDEDGGFLVIGLNTDEWMRRNKRDPFIDFYTRMHALQEYGKVWPIEVEGDIPRHLRNLLVLAQKDNVYLVKGMDYKPYKIRGASIEGVTLVRVPLLKDQHGNKLSSSG